MQAWCERRQTAAGATLDVETLWRLAGTWYNDRLDLNWRRRTTPERQAILDTVGLGGPFWRLIEST